MPKDPMDRIEAMHAEIKALEAKLRRKLTQAEVNAVAEKHGAKSFDYSRAKSMPPPS